MVPPFPVDLDAKTPIKPWPIRKAPGAKVTVLALSFRARWLMGIPGWPLFDKALPFVA